MAAKGMAVAQSRFMAGFNIQLTRKRVRCINLRIRPDGTIAVSAPLRTPLSAIESFVESRSAWIERNQKRIASRAAVVCATCAPNETIWLWGEPLACRIIVESRPARGPRMGFERGEGELIARVRESDAGSDDEALARRNRALDRWLRDQLSQRVDALLPHCEEVVGKRATSIRLKDMKSRWGSCNVKTGAISLAVRLTHYDPRCLEMVLYHELCHLIEPSHNARFHALMDSFCPDWHERNALLNSR